MIDLAFRTAFGPPSRRRGHVRSKAEASNPHRRALRDRVLRSRRRSTGGPVVSYMARSDTASWTEVSQSPRRWSDGELAALESSDIGIGVVTDADELTLLVTTADGVFERVIPNASPLSRLAERGIAAEDAIRDAAATWGLPDFVLKPHTERKGNAVREVSDGMLLVGNRGLSIQVKSRDAAADEPAREHAWLTKKIAEAARQATGTVRRLSTTPANMTNGRDRIDPSRRRASPMGWCRRDRPSGPACRLRRP